MSTLVLVPIFFALADICFAYYLYRKIKKDDTGENNIVEIARAIRQGARAFLIREFKSMAVVFLLVAIVLALIQKTILAPVIFLLGAVISSLTGYLSIMISTMANPRIINKALKNFSDGFRIIIKDGQILGFLINGIGFLGILIVWIIFCPDRVNLLINYAFGTSLVALFMRVGSGIFTKSADIGVDLADKFKSEDPGGEAKKSAFMTDNIGNNIGDITGKGSDLFESYVSSIIAAMVIGVVGFGTKGLFLPLMLVSVGIIGSFAGSFMIMRSKKILEANINVAKRVVQNSLIVANSIVAILSFILVQFYFHDLRLFWIILLSLVSGFVINKAIEYYTSTDKKPVLEVAKATQIGPSNVIMEGLAMAMKNIVVPVLTIVVTISLAYYLGNLYDATFGGFYGIALASVSILGVLGINLSIESFGSIADNAIGLTEMSDLNIEDKRKVAELKTISSRTTAIGKGFNIGSAALVALAWLVIYVNIGELPIVNLLGIKVIIGIFIGAILPFLFSALLINSVSRGALEILNEIKRQNKTADGVSNGGVDYKNCTDLATKITLKEMVLPAILGIIVPILMGIIFGKEAVVGTLLGTLSSGLILSVFMTGAGNIWHNVRKYIEAGNLGGTDTEGYKAAIVGDTLGDPLKDAAGPSINILIKITAIVALLALPLFI